MNFLEELIPLARLRWLRLAVLAGLLVLVGAVSLEVKLSVLDLDVWWHLKTGDWIIQHGGFPRTGIFSRSAADHSWAAYSWGYEVLLSRFYAWFGLVGIGLYGALLTLMVAFSVYWMVRRLSGNFWMACFLAVLCCYSFLFLMMPRPVFFSVAMLCVVLTLLLQAQRTGNIRELYWIPLLFLLWANLHIQFIYGLAIWGLFVAVNISQRLAERHGFTPAWLTTSKLSAKSLAILFGSSLLATLIGPYSYHLYTIVFAYSRSQLIYSMITELQPLSFRAYEHFVELLLTGAAFFIAARQKQVNPYKVVLLVTACIFGFHTMRDSWFLCVCAAACIADSSGELIGREANDTLPQLVAVFAVTAGVLFILAPGLDFNQRGLDRAVSGRFPVNAVNFVRQNRIRGPLFNNFDWGGFLIWYLPEYPVSLDGRTDLYGDVLDQQLLRTLNGDPSYKTDPYLRDAGLVLLRRRDGLASSLEIDPSFRKVYEDQMAVVFVPE